MKTAGKVRKTFAGQNPNKVKTMIPPRSASVNGSSPDGTYETEGNPRNQGNSKETDGKFLNLRETHETQAISPSGNKDDKKPKTFNDFLREAVETAHRLNYQEFKDRKWRTPCFQLVRILKTHHELGPMTAAKAIKKIEVEIRKWEANGIKDFWGQFFFSTRADAHMEIVDTWDKIKWLPGKSVMENALELAKRRPLRIDAETFEKRGNIQAYLDFTSLCGWLQATLGADVPIAVPCREFGELLGLSPMTISRMRKWSVEDGHMTPHRAHEFHGAKNDKNAATQFLFRYDMWPVLQKFVHGEE